MTTVNPMYMRLSENGYFPQSLRQAQILILKILQCILAGKIFAFLDLAKNLSFSDKLIGDRFLGAYKRMCLQNHQYFSYNQGKSE